MKDWKPEQLKEQFERQLEVAKLQSTYPYHKDIIPKIEAIADLIFHNDTVYLSHSSLATRLLACISPFKVTDTDIQHGYTSMDAVYVTGQFLQLPKESHSLLSNNALTSDYFHFLGRRLLLLNATFGHAESIFQNIRHFESAKHLTEKPQYNSYRDQTITTLESLADAYPDTRPYSAMITLERTTGGNLDRARQYTLRGLERATRPRGYEMILINAGAVLPDSIEGMKALRLALELLVSGIQQVQSDPFPFATIQRWISNYLALKNVSEVIRLKARDIANSTDARDLAKFRATVLAVKKEVKNRLQEKGVDVNVRKVGIFPSRSLDDILFQLLDPEAVVEEEELMKIRPVRDRQRADEASASAISPEMIGDVTRPKQLNA
jgi:hypothetical protein